MTIPGRMLFYGLLLMFLGVSQGWTAELKVSRDALERTLKQQLFSGPNGRYFLKGNAQSSCSVYAENPSLNFVQDRIVVRVKTHARLGKGVGGACLGISLAPVAEVSLAPFGEGQSIGFRDAQVLKVSDQRELNFLLAPFLGRQVPRSMRVDAAELLRKALAGSTASSGYKVTVDRLKVHSVQVEGDDLVVDVDGDISVQ
jgi:hypothetical protein